MSIKTTSKSDVQAIIDQTLIDFFENLILKAHEVDEHYEMLWKTLFDLHRSGGKRIRPKIVLMSYIAFGGDDYSSVAPVACAQELLHFSMLIHDDIIDRDIVRYGVDNITGTYEKLYTPFVFDASDRLHYANSAAIMAGDLMIASAHKLINDSSLGNDKKIAAQSIMYQSIFDVAGGELLDTESSFRPIGAIDALKIAHFKTASYSFVGPFLTGASLAGASKKDLATLRDLAVHVGIAYQLTDDLLGIFGDEAKTGKSNTGDLREGKRTHLIDLTLKKLSPKQLLVFQANFGKHDVTDAALASLKEIIIETGAKYECEQLIDQYISQARKSLQMLALSKSSHEQFSELVTNATNRDF